MSQPKQPIEVSAGNASSSNVQPADDSQYDDLLARITNLSDTNEARYNGMLTSIQNTRRLVTQMVQTQETLKKNDAARDERLKGLEDAVETASENIDILSAQNPDKIRCIQYSTKRSIRTVEDYHRTPV